MKNGGEHPDGRIVYLRVRAVLRIPSAWSICETFDQIKWKVRSEENTDVRKAKDNRQNERLIDVRRKQKLFGMIGVAYRWIEKID